MGALHAGGCRVETGLTAAIMTGMNEMIDLFPTGVARGQPLLNLEAALKEGEAFTLKLSGAPE